MTNITLRMFWKSGDFACMSRLKAAEAKALIPVFIDLLKQNYDGSPRDGHRLIAFEALGGCYRVIDGVVMFLSSLQHEQLK